MAMAKNRTALVLLPGMDGTGDLFDPFRMALGDEVDARIVRYPTDETLGYDELQSLVRATLPGDRPFVLLGESFSGPIAITLAAEGPAGLRGLILGASFARNPRPSLTVLRPLLGVIPFGRAPVGILSRLLLGPDSSDELRASLARAVGRVEAAVFRARLRAVLSVDVTARLAAVRVPVLYLRAAQDRVVPRAAGDLVARTLPRTETVEIRGHHLLLQTAPAEAARVVGAFVRNAREGRQPVAE